MAPALNRQLLLATQCGLLLTYYAYERLKSRKLKRRRKMWVRDILQERMQYGQFHTLLQEARLHDRESFYRLVVVV